MHVQAIIDICSGSYRMSHFFIPSWSKKLQDEYSDCCSHLCTGAFVAAL